MKLKSTNNTAQAFWIGVGSLSSFLVGIISAGFLSRYFDKAEYGTYRQVLYVYNSLLVIFSAGLPSVFSYFLPRYSIAQGKDIVFKITNMLALIGLAFSFFLFVFSDLIAVALKNPDLSTGLRYFSPIPFFILPTIGIEGIFSTYKKSVYVAVYNIITRISTVLLIVLPVIYFKGTYLYAIYGWIAGSVISFCIALYFKNIPFEKISSEVASLSVKEVFQYTLPIVIASIAGIAIKSADQFFVSRYFGPEVFADYANGFIEIPFIGMVTGASATVLMPIFSRIVFEKSGVDKIISIWNNAIMKSAVMIYPIVVLFIFNSSEIMTLVYSEKYSLSSIYFQINMVINFFNIVMFAPLLLAMGKTRMYSMVHIILAVVIWLSDYLVFLIYNDPVAIAINTTLINIFKIILFMFLISRLLSVSLFKLIPLGMIIKLLLHSLSVLYIVKLVQNNYFVSYSLFVQLILIVIVYGGLLLISSIIFKIDYLAPFKPIIHGYINK